jgi:signal transduction histidine kinase
MRIRDRIVDAVSSVPARVQTKLLVAFLTMAALLMLMGAVGLQALHAVNRQTEELIQLQRKIAAFRQVQHDTTAQLYGVTSALLAPDEQVLQATLRQLTQFGYDLDRLQYVASDEVQLLARVRGDYDRFIAIVTRVVELAGAGQVAEARTVQRDEAGPLADRLERLTNQLVNLAEAEMISGIDASQQAYARAWWIVVAIALGSVLLALGLGYVISWSLVGPVTEIKSRLRGIAEGDFSGRVEVASRDELGELADNLNRTARKLGLLYEQLEAASRHKSQFLANTSHELRTPLNAILGYTELIQDGIYGEVPAKIGEVLERVQAGGRHLLGLINDVLDLSKIEAGQLVLSITDYSMTEVVERVVLAAGPLAGEKGLALKVSLQDELPFGQGDDRRITQVLLNLVGNAIKFTESGEVAVNVTAANGAFEVAVADTGPGIAPDDQERVFEEFRQLDGSSTRTKGGTGLGLAISRKIIELHAGRIWVESEAGYGSTFRFSLPLRSPARSASA